MCQIFPKLIMQLHLLESNSLFSNQDCADHDLTTTFWQLWQQHRDYLYRRCCYWMGNSIDAEDALSQAMLKAWDKVQTGKGAITNNKAWLTRLTYNLCIDIYRKRNRVERSFESLELMDFELNNELVSQEESPVLAATQQELEIFFCVAIDQLPPRLRETFILYFQEELSYQEISEKLNISPTNSRKRISQSRAILREQLNEYLG